MGEKEKLTIEKLIQEAQCSNALQWRLQYQRIVSLTEDIPGVEKIIAYNKPE